MTLSELRALLATLPDTTRLELVIYEYQRSNGLGSAARFPLDSAEAHDGVLRFSAVIDVEAAEP